MKMIKSIWISGIVLLFLACGASQKIKEPNVALDEMITQKTFEIKIRTAEPLVTQAMGQVANSGILPPGNTIGRIDVAGSGYYIKVQGETVSANLPYFGERQMGGGYDSDSGIKFDGIPANLEVIKDEIKQSYTINFSIDSSSENYLVSIFAGNKLSSTTSIRSSHRNSIRYTGDLSIGQD